MFSVAKGIGKKLAASLRAAAGPGGAKPGYGFGKKHFTIKVKFSPAHYRRRSGRLALARGGGELLPAPGPPAKWHGNCMITASFAGSGKRRQARFARVKMAGPAGGRC
jgi:hypothetical protein